jgi:hypothetical protein
MLEVSGSVFIDKIYRALRIWCFLHGVQSFSFTAVFGISMVVICSNGRALVLNFGEQRSKGTPPATRKLQEGLGHWGGASE